MKKVYDKLNIVYFDRSPIVSRSAVNIIVCVKSNRVDLLIERLLGEFSHAHNQRPNQNRATTVVHVLFYVKQPIRLRNKEKP